MKFTDGFWLMRAGVVPHYATDVADAIDDGRSLTVWAATRPLAGRTATLGGPLLTVRLSSPMRDVISVRMSHWEGTPEPRPTFELSEPEEPAGAQVSREGAAAALRSGRLEARVATSGPWRLDFAGDGRFLTGSGARNLAWIEAPSGGPFCVEELALGVGETIYGLGERFTPFVKNGQAVDIWNEDGGTASEQAYKNVPFYLSNRGYGVFVRHAGRVSFEVGSEKVSRVQFSVPGESLEYLVIYGPTPKEVLEMQWCDFEWDRRVFPDPGVVDKEFHPLQSGRAAHVHRKRPLDITPEAAVAPVAGKRKLERFRLGQRGGGRA